MNPRDQELERLYRELFTPLFRYMLLRTKDYNLATDLVQTVFLKFLQSDYQAREKVHNTRTLFVVARNTLIDHWRVNASRTTTSLEALKLDPASDIPTPFEEFRTNEDVTIVQEALSTLSDVEQDIVMLRITTDLDYQTIAEMLGETPENTRQKYSRSLRNVKEYSENKNIYG